MVALAVIVKFAIKALAMASHLAIVVEKVAKMAKSWVRREELEDPEMGRLPGVEQRLAAVEEQLAALEERFRVRLRTGAAPFADP
ncbi:hypothetical protein HG530_001073 [Fusarium avenaceum]|nr:hypothetical protein HG530_001073 [Fusarium avenaceum]KIL88796.1 hypothetical protein FAVG1_08045 [Fusarium avenaceum]